MPEQDELTSEEAVAAIAAVHDWIEAAIRTGEMLDGFGFNAEANQVFAVVDQLEFVIARAIAGLEEE